MNQVLQNIIILVVGIIFIGILASIGSSILNQGETEVSGALDNPIGRPAIIMPRAASNNRFHIIWVPDNIESVRFNCTSLEGEVRNINNFDGTNGPCDFLECDWFKLSNNYRVIIDWGEDCDTDSIRITDLNRNRMVATSIIPYNRHRAQNLV